MITEWHDKELIEKVESIIDQVCREGAGWVAADAKNILRTKPKHPTGKLASEIDVKVSRFKAGGWMVQAQGPGNHGKFYATFVELGTHKMQAIPYLRPALRMNKTKIYQAYRDKL